MSRARGSDLARLAVLVALSLLAVSALAVAGCGGTSVSGTSAPGTSAATASSATTTSAPVENTSTTSGQTVDSSSTSTSASAEQTANGWPVYHHDAARSGVSDDQAALGDVRRAWTSQTLDGAVYAQPLVAGERVYVATEGNSVYALAAATGVVVWQQNLGEPVPGSALPCGNIDPSGITGTPVIDTSAGVLYVVANLKTGPHHELFALSLADGTVQWHRAIDPAGLEPVVEQERGALALSGGRVYVPFGGLYGDCGPYKGAVVSAATDGTGDLAAYVVATSRMAGIWNPAGPVVDGAGDIWVTTGNSAGRSSFDFGNAIIRLDAGLQLVDYFAPSNWAQLNAGDVDLGSVGPVLLPGGQVLAAGKDGMAYLVSADDLGHVGDPAASLDIGASAFGAAAVLENTVFIPTTKALVALHAASGSLSSAWKVSGGSCPPIVAGGAVWALGYDGTLRALDPATGKELFSDDLGRPVSRFISPSAAGGRVFVPDGDAIVAYSLR